MSDTAAVNTAAPNAAKPAIGGAERPAQDTYPRVVHFEEYFDELEIIGRPKHLLWQCYVYTIAVPFRSKNRLNILEELTLKLSALGNGNTAEIAEFTCMKPDIVLFIQNRLMQNGFLDKYFAISDEGKQLIEKWETEKPEYAVARVYQDCASGVFLPFINFDEPVYEEIEKRSSESISFHIGIKGNPITGQIIKGNAPCRPPSTREVLRIIKQHQKKYRRYATLRGGERPPPSAAIQESAISIQQGRERIYLHCRAMVLKGNPDIVVSDGFGLGYSENFASFLKTQNFSWLIDLKEMGIIKKFGETDATSVKKDPLHCAREAIETWKHKPSASSNEERQKKRAVEKGVEKLYDVIEHIFAGVVFTFPVDEWLDKYQKGQYTDIKRLVSDFAEHIGFCVNEKNGSLLGALPGKFRGFSEGTVELQPCLALAITAARYDTAHPLNRLASASAGFLDFLVTLKQFRDSIKHGDASVEINIGELEELLAETEKALRILDPGAAQRKIDADVGNAAYDYDQQRLKATVELEKMFGVGRFQLMERDIRELLYKVEMMSMDMKPDRVSEYFTGDFVNTLASLLQNMFHALLIEQDIFNQPKASTDIKKHIREKLTKAGLLKTGETLPKTIENVNPARLQNAVQGTSMSLQADCAAFFALCGREILLAIVKNKPDILKLVDSIAILRGHGNTAVNMPCEELLALKKQVFDTVKIIYGGQNG
jgi:hypothetical protein